MFYFRYVVYLYVIVNISLAGAGSCEDFFTAIQRDDGGVVAALLQRGFDPNSADPSGRPSLLTAVQAQSPNVVKALLAHPDLKVDALNTAGESALMLAALKGAMSRTLLNH